MNIKHIKLKNWRNFQTVEVPLADTTYILGANASGKSNFLDVFRFLRDVSKREGGGLQKAVLDRGGMSKLRCLHARRSQVSIEVNLLSPTGTRWRYTLEFKSEGKGAQRILVSKEEVHRDDALVLTRPNEDDGRDPTRLTQTHLEQIQANESFRELAEFFSETTYLHLVPQLLKHSQQIGGQVLEDDPFGQGFLERIARAQERSRISRLAKIQKALQIAVPQFEELKFEKDEFTGRPHLTARFKHFRPNAGWQREEQFSDGTLRLLGLLWSLLESSSLLLMEEPELSLNSSIVREIPEMMHRIQRQSKRRRQIFISSHSEALLSNQGIDAGGVLLVEPGENGSTIREMDIREANAIKDGFSIAEVILPAARPTLTKQISMAFE
ncbi:AAA family ATPase [uncultured Sphingomonas sp.]|uniref:AAA family ATPase n=1 Tax=uncultured Sphingomonas sp. TaxID=158754 RepID=UPI0035CA203E